MFPLLTNGRRSPNYEPPVTQSFYVVAKQRGCSAIEALYDYLVEGDGSNLVHFPIFNYNEGSLAIVGDMLRHPRALYGLSDSGAHVGTICDASTTTYLMTRWGHAIEEGGLGIERVIEMLTRRNARHMGLSDRGEIAVGLRADLNLIDPTRLDTGMPQIVRDLPAGGRRLLQKGEGYLGTWVAGQAVARHGEVTQARPGKLVRLNADRSSSRSL
jgi:N-acyl-D-aspartate/D-glutamate deacylase